MQPKEAPRRQRPPGGSRSFLQGPEGGRNGIAAAFGIVFDYVRADLEFGTNRFKDVGVRYKGNGTFLSSRDHLKRSFKIDLNQFVKGQKLAGSYSHFMHPHRVGRALRRAPVAGSDSLSSGPSGGF